MYEKISNIFDLKKWNVKKLRKEDSEKLVVIANLSYSITIIFPF